MSKNTSLDTLVELTQNQSDEAGRHLQALAQQRDAAGQQLEMLQGYRQDYAQRLLDAGSGGLSMANYHNFRRFIATLDEAITQQNKIIQNFEQKMEQGREAWNAHKRRLNAYEALVDRRRHALQIRQDKAEQRQSDEISARIFARAQNVF